MRKDLKSKLDGGNTIKATNSLAVAVKLHGQKMVVEVSSRSGKLSMKKFELSSSMWHAMERRS